MKQTESALHAAVADYLTVGLPSRAWFTTFPLGGGGMIRGAQLKRWGVRKGSPDILIVFESEAFFIELKTEKGRVSEAQEECHADLQEAGARIAVCRSVDDVASALNVWGIRKRRAA